MRLTLTLLELVNVINKILFTCTSMIILEGFSEDGDSGSVIYDEDMNGSVLVLALLYGSINDKDGNFLFTYASHIMRLKELLQNKYKISIEPGIVCSYV